MRRMGFILTAFLGLVFLAPARADFIVTVQPASIPQDSSGYVDVTLTSDSATGDKLASFFYQLKVEPVSSAGRLEFGTSTFGDLAASSYPYVFVGLTPANGGPPNGNSGNYSSNSDPLGSPFANPVPGSNFNGNGDFTADGSDVVIKAGDAPLLITRVLLNPGPGTLAPVSGDTFLVSVVPQSNSVAATGFFDSSGKEVPFTSVPGTVTITPANVPEPGSLALLVCGGGVGLLARRRLRGRRAA